MALIKSKGQMYDWITHQWNPVSGECYHNCSYCYMHRWGKQSPIHLRESEFKTDLGCGNFIFVCSGTDLFAEDVPGKWILKTLRKCYDHNNKYLFQTKNPKRILDFNHAVFFRSVICTTLESDIFYPEIMNNSPQPMQRSMAMEIISKTVDTYVTVEPIMDFNLEHFVHMINRCKPKQCNIGADSGKKNLPEPSKEKVLELISELEKFTIVKQKSNLSRIVK